MAAMNLQTPGVYIEELNAFPNSVVVVATAVPAFIGYPPQAAYEGKSLLNKPQKITSMGQFKAIYMLPDAPPPAAPTKQYSPDYYLVEQKDKPGSGDYLLLNGGYYSILPDPNTIYYMYNSIRLFFENGGGDAYIVSVGSYGEASKKPLASPTTQIVNPNVTFNDLKHGLELLKNEIEPTMYVCPDATLLSVENNGTLMESMLLQAEEMETAMCIFDIIGGRNPDPIMYTKDIETFRNNTGSNGLKFGASYYPFIGTTIMQQSDIDFTNFFGGDIKKLGSLLSPPSNPSSSVAKIINAIENPSPTSPLSNTQLQAALLIASPTYATIVKHVLADANILPPSGGIAGVYTTNDSELSVWHAPANVSVVGAANLPINLSDSQQADLNVDAVSGKSVNAIRFFNGLGIVVWGARTLDGNSEDWRYIPVRRTITMLEQSAKLAARAYVFEANDANTWNGIKSMITSFLTDIWKQGGLQGSTAAAAFQVEVGLGSTMTAEDILKGVMRVSVKVAVTHPAEFIVITFQQEMATSGMRV